VITLDQVKTKMAGFRLRLAGTTNFDGKLNFRARLGLPPLGLVGIPMKITGSSENPKIKYGRGNDENAPETEYSDQVPKEMLDRIKNAKEEDIEEPVK
jgi:AsmA protein